MALKSPFLDQFISDSVFLLRCSSCDLFLVPSMSDIDGFSFVALKKIKLCFIIGKC